MKEIEQVKMDVDVEEVVPTKSDKVKNFIRNNWKKVTAIAGALGGGIVLGYVLANNDDDQDDYRLIEATYDLESEN